VAGNPTRTRSLILLPVVAGLMLGTAAIASGLDAVDGWGDFTPLAVVGASSRVRRILALSPSGVIAGLGSLLGRSPGLARPAWSWSR
jgi:putative ABC transport system permease protein